MVKKKKVALIETQPDGKAALRDSIKQLNDLIEAVEEGWIACPHCIADDMREVATALDSLA